MQKRNKINNNLILKTLQKDHAEIEGQHDKALALAEDISKLEEDLKNTQEEIDTKKKDVNFLINREDRDQVVKDIEQKEGTESAEEINRQYDLRDATINDHLD